MNKPISAIKSLDKLPKQVEDQFRELCRLAYEGIMEDRIIFEDLGRDFNTLGLLQGVESLTDGGKSLSHNFLHLSIQELLAALHMATQLTPKQQIAKFRELFGRPRFAAVFSFYSAHTKLKTTGMDQVLVEAVKKCLENKKVSELTPHPDSGSKYYKSADKPKPLLLSLMACLYEAEDKELYETVVKEFTDSKLDLTGISLTVYDCLILGNFIAHCKQFDVDLDNCSIHAEECKTLFRPDAKYNIKSLDLADNSIGVEGAVAISEAMKTMTNLKVLHLENNSIGDKGAVAISEAMKTMTNLKELDLGANSIGDEGAVAISEAMKTMTNLQTLGLHYNSIGDEGAVAISEAMKTMTNLQGLVLDDNDAITEVGREAVKEAAKLSGTRICWIEKDS